MTESTPAAPTPTWEVTGQVETTSMDANQNFVPGWNVTFQTGIGVIGSVFIPNTLYTPEFARQAIADKVAMIYQVHGLNSGA